MHWWLIHLRCSLSQNTVPQSWTLEQAWLICGGWAISGASVGASTSSEHVHLFSMQKTGPVVHSVWLHSRSVEHCSGATALAKLDNATPANNVLLVLLLASLLQTLINIETHKSEKTHKLLWPKWGPK